jgi:hypothetical protein
MDILPEQELKTKTPNEALMASIDKTVQVLVIGLNKDGEIHMETSRPTYEFVNYILNRGVFEINRLESNTLAASAEARRIAAENKVSEAVQQDVAEQITAMKRAAGSNDAKASKRGRPKKEVL